MRTHSFAAVMSALAASWCFWSSSALAAPPPPKGAHPRIWLTPDTEAAVKAKLETKGSAAARVVALCKQVKARPNEFRSNSEWQWAFAAPSCALAWRLTNDASYAESAITLFQALLDDYRELGDGAGGDDVVRHDSGYYIRIHAPYAALVYDWMHDAPGMTESLKAHARARFAAWIDWYTKTGYLRSTPGANYHAGFVFAKTLIAIAEAGEAGETGDLYWQQVVDDVFGKQIVAQGLAPNGPLTGGDWPEGWQYGSLSVIEYALAARALEEQGVELPAVDAWTSDLAVNYLYSVPPSKEGLFTNGDIDNEKPFAPLASRPLVAVIAGPGSDEAAAWAAFLRANVAKETDSFPVFDALAEARDVSPVDFESTSPPSWYVAEGMRKLYVRSGWGKAAGPGTWAVFTSAPRQVPDHQHVDASNFVFSRGADAIISDPSPYGSLSTLTGNAITVDSNTVSKDARPSQSIWDNRAEMPWARMVTSGIAAARAELSGAFRGPNGKASDVPFARRDWAFLPEGEIVVIDRARTGDPARGMNVRFRTQANLEGSGGEPFEARGTLGSSKMIIRAVSLSGGTPEIRSVPRGSCDNVTWGQCDAARYRVDEYRVDVPGPEMASVHVIGGLGADEADPVVSSITSPEIAGEGGGNDAVLGAVVRRNGIETYVVASSAQDGNAGPSMVYGFPAEGVTRHVVFDAPENGQGKSTVTARAEGGRCVLTITAGGADGFEGHPLVFSVGRAAEGCALSEDKTVPPGSVRPGGGSPKNPKGAAERASGEGCGCRTVGTTDHPWILLVMAGALLGLAASRRRARS